ncbi:hypothetical protein BWQ96_02466 [Gracilariopsis chorda]|uniref:RING-type domain-containing protein n=1 Tax=Gracilariopsis chorda TaxID=448386 RepID=A0A2V3J060_9FLOR|nr:hypothetical protein BWQ96_02466 [Gracilariopsis chorda]|eukprot:PXF47784.1 hypothetical protein BWQ96_02466 [Gracilariopsis chorda]
MPVLLTVQRLVSRQSAVDVGSTSFPAAIRTLASVVASVTMVVTIYLGYKKCFRNRLDSFEAERRREAAHGFPLTSLDQGSNGFEDLVPVYVGEGRYMYISRDEIPRRPQHVVRVNSVHSPRFDADSLKIFEAGPSERQQACAICLEQLEEETVSAGQCLHLMHTNCLASWLRKDINSNCPVCRVRIFESASLESLGERAVGIPSQTAGDGSEMGNVFSVKVVTDDAQDNGHSGESPSEIEPYAQLQQASAGNIGQNTAVSVSADALGNGAERDGSITRPVEERVGGLEQNSWRVVLLEPSKD